MERVEDIAKEDPSPGVKTFDVPMRELGFLGSPAKEMVLIMPCSDCLIAVVDKPVRAAVLRAFVLYA